MLLDNIRVDTFEYLKPKNVFITLPREMIFIHLFSEYRYKGYWLLFRFDFMYIPFILWLNYICEWPSQWNKPWDQLLKYTINKQYLIYLEVLGLFRQKVIIPIFNHKTRVHWTIVPFVLFNAVLIVLTGKEKYYLYL